MGVPMCGRADNSKVILMCVWNVIPKCNSKSVF
nr:MAG TPA: hypothetical protein [Caudoviricetes sp.]